MGFGFLDGVGGSQGFGFFLLLLLLLSEQVELFAFAPHLELFSLPHDPLLQLLDTPELVLLLDVFQKLDVGVVGFGRRVFLLSFLTIRILIFVSRAASSIARSLSCLVLSSTC